MGLVVEHDDLALAAAKTTEHSSDDGLRRLNEGVLLDRLSTEQQLASVGRDTLDLTRKLRQELVVVHDIDLCLAELLAEIRWHQAT